MYTLTVTHPDRPTEVQEFSTLANALVTMDTEMMIPGEVVTLTYLGDIIGVRHYGE